MLLQIETITNDVAVLTTGKVLQLSFNCPPFFQTEFVVFDTDLQQQIRKKQEGAKVAWQRLTNNSVHHHPLHPQGRMDFWCLRTLILKWPCKTCFMPWHDHHNKVQITRFVNKFLHLILNKQNTSQTWAYSDVPFLLGKGVFWDLGE